MTAPVGQVARVARVAVVGGGITGLAAALALAESAAFEVTVFERADHVGGRIGTSPFAGLAHVDEGADAFLARVPEAVALARKVGLGDQLVSPEPIGAAVWHDGLHQIPDGLVLGLPGRVWPLATTGLLSWRGKLRAAVEPLLPRTSTADDSIGAFVRARFGDEVHERLVDSLVGSIYAADTDRFSLAEVPQLAALAAANRSVLLAARRQRRRQQEQAGTATAAASPVFATPRNGIGALTAATSAAAAAAGATIVTNATVESITPTRTAIKVVVGDGFNGTLPFDAVVLATPAAVAASALRDASPAAADLLARAERADVVMATLHVPADQWPERLRGLSGYLVPKPVQRRVTAVSFGSQKWAHWRPPDGGEILRVSLGRDGAPVLHLDDDEILRHVLDDLRLHLGVAFAPREVRITRWPGAFAQYRPHHAAWVDSIERELPPQTYLAGASYRGIGIPACVRDAQAVAARITTDLEGSPS